jgi:hypothetical protein
MVSNSSAQVAFVQEAVSASADDERGPPHLPARSGTPHDEQVERCAHRFTAEVRPLTGDLVVGELIAEAQIVQPRIRTDDRTEVPPGKRSSNAERPTTNDSQRDRQQADCRRGSDERDGTKVLFAAAFWRDQRSIASGSSSKRSSDGGRASLTQERWRRRCSKAFAALQRSPGSVSDSSTSAHVAGCSA